MRRALILALALAAGCGETKPTGDKLPPANETFDKTDKDMKDSKGKAKKASDFG